MSEVQKELIRELVKEKKFTSTGQILDTLKEMFRGVLQGTLESEFDEQMGYDKYDVGAKPGSNSRNGYSKKTLKSELGNVEINMPRDRQGEFEPVIVPKHERNVTGIEEKVLALYSKGMTTRDIHDQEASLRAVKSKKCMG